MIDASVDADQPKRAIRKVGRETDRIIVDALRDGPVQVTKTLLQNYAPRRSGNLRRNIRVGAQLRSKRKGPAIRMVLGTVYGGLQEFGGTIKGEIKPKNARALLIAPGVYRAKVTKTRVYKGQLFAERTVQQIRPYAGRVIQDHVTRELRRALERDV